MSQTKPFKLIPGEVATVRFIPPMNPVGTPHWRALQEYAVADVEAVRAGTSPTGRVPSPPVNQWPCPSQGRRLTPIRPDGYEVIWTSLSEAERRVLARLQEPDHSLPSGTVTIRRVPNGSGRMSYALSFERDEEETTESVLPKRGRLLEF